MFATRLINVDTTLSLDLNNVQDKGALWRAGS